jgi:hypothetical protein
MSGIRKSLIAFGVFWASLWVIPLIDWPISKLTNRITYTQSTLFDAFALGIINSLARAVTAILAGVLLAVVVDSRKPELWAVIVAGLYLIYAPRLHWIVPATGWDRLWRGVDHLFPPVACIVAAFITARMRTRVAEPL